MQNSLVKAKGKDWHALISRAKSKSSLASEYCVTAREEIWRHLLVRFVSIGCLYLLFNDIASPIFRPHFSFKYFKDITFDI